MALVDTSVENPTLRGAKYRGLHRLTVIGVLGDRAPKVSSRGSRFYNRDRWTLRFFVSKMCKWAKENPQCIPTRKDIAGWVKASNAERVEFREIVIANTPSRLTLRTALALTGGAYHEAFHTHYDRLTSLTVNEMCDLVLPRWAKVPDWSRYPAMLLEWSNIIADIRIERLGCVEFEGCITKLHDLQDFILGQEAKGLANLRAHTGKPKANPSALSIVTATFRDVGLGYNTDLQREALEGYRAANNEAVQLVLGAGKGNPGPLTELLKESIALTTQDDMGSLRIAMDVIGVLYNESSEEDPANDPDNEEHQPGEDHKTVCPDCGAKGSKLVVRPKSDGRGGKIPNKGILTCSVCGFQTEVDLQPPQQGQGGAPPPKQDPDYTPRFEGFDKDDSPQQGGSQGDDSGDSQTGGDGGDSGGGGEPSDGDEDGDDDDGEGSGGDGEEGDEDKGEGGSGSDGEGGFAGNDWSDEDLAGEGDDSGEDEDLATGTLDEGGVVGASSANESNTDSDAGNEQGAAGGGHTYEKGAVKGNDWSDLVDDALDAAGDDTGLKDNNSALEDAVNSEADDEERREGGVKKGERAWKPYDPSQDEFVFVKPSQAGKEHDRAQAERLYASVKEQAAFLRSRLRTIVKALEMANTIHGTRRGRRLSSRFLVDSRASIMGGKMPRRAYTQVDEAMDTSLAAAIVIDESGSMYGALKDATRVLCAICEPLDSLGCPVQVSGFRNGERYTHRDAGDQDDGDYHRHNSITHDIFKTFDEPLRLVKWRFANTRATGGTPMADGVQFALDALSRRNEGHRVMFVVTDGQPNYGHQEIIRRQCRLAKAAGVNIIGVGLGHGAKYVQDVFPDSVWTANISDMPKALIGKLNDLIDVKASKRGRRVASTGA